MELINMFYKVPQKWLNTFKRFIRSLENASHKCGNFTKWFQFYWDFCNKYNFPDNDTGSLPHFLHKLKEKGNDEDAISSARNTINYYYEMFELLEYHKNKKENKKNYRWDEVSEGFPVC